MFNVVWEETKEDRRNYFKNLVEGNLKEHVLIRERDGQWLCRKPGTGMYHFRVILVPGTILFFGDMGDCIINPTGPSSLEWLRVVFDQVGYDYEVDYFMGKVVPSLRESRKVFLVSEAMRHIEDRTDFDSDSEDCFKGDILRKTWWRIKEEASDFFGLPVDRLPSSLMRDTWSLSYIEVYEGCDIPSCDDWSDELLTVFFALSKFFSLLKENSYFCVTGQTGT